MSLHRRDSVIAPEPKNPIHAVQIVERAEPGLTVTRLLTIDDRIPVDAYMPSAPYARWYCDHCDEGAPVTVQFRASAKRWITLCATCLQHALNGIAYSMANPIDPGTSEVTP